MLYFIGYTDVKNQPLALDIYTLDIYILKFGSYNFDRDLDPAQILRKYQSTLSETVKINIILLKNKIIQSIEERLTNFINHSQQRTMRQHELDLIPKIGAVIKKKILDNRNNGYTDFSDIHKKSGCNIKAIVFDSILEQLKNNKYCLISLINNDQSKNKT